MKRTIYIILCIISVGLLGYTGYYTVHHKEAPVVEQTATSTEDTAIVDIAEDPNTYTTKSGKTLSVVETNPLGESLSTITITPKGFVSNTPIILETNKLTNRLYADLNNDGLEELIITTTAQGSGSFGEVIMFTTANREMLLPVTIPEITEDDTKKGALFEGYMGHDSFIVENNSLIQEFPTYKKTDTMSEPTGPRKAVLYTLNKKDGAYFVTFTQATTTPSIITSSSTSQTATTTLSASSTKK